MAFWKQVLQGLAASLENPKSDVKLQVRFARETVWRDAGWVASNTESVQNGIQLMASAYPDANVRAVDQNGSLLDFS